MKQEARSMSLFHPRKNKSKWASVVVGGYKPGMNIDEKILDEATDVYIKQHARILFESIHIVLTSKNEDTRKERYKLATSHYGSLTKVYRFATKEQKAGIDLAEHEYLSMVEKYRHPYRETHLPSVRGYHKRKAKKDAFWEVYGEAEALDIFSGKKK